MAKHWTDWDGNIDEDEEVANYRSPATRLSGRLLTDEDLGCE